MLDLSNTGVTKLENLGPTLRALVLAGLELTLDPRTTSACVISETATGRQARTLRDWAEFELQQGRADEARDKLSKAWALFSQLDAAPELSRTAELLNSIP